MIMVVFLAVSLSLDALGIGASYGARGIRIPLFTKIILTAESLLIMGLSITLGSKLADIFSLDIAKYIGVGLLLIMGLWLLTQGISQERMEKKESHAPSAMNMVRTPSSCDRDGSHTLDAAEAISLGLVLSIDSFGAGIGAGAAGLDVIGLSICIAVFQIFFLTTGAYWGGKIAACSNLQEHLWSIISGILLVLIALLRTVI